ncbi:hypothetical protein LSTR_LSTR007702 [Laodelphax striatellus]|uniref:Uncharacterized protein n=1 Tax=Laodelphax striatellus TaxID=195883 RepID=A0A482WIK4_LAOST|nr:hypothetical protein LSTR_LSTR007702 [Laodelphax striatellus]
MTIPDDCHARRRLWHRLVCLRLVPSGQGAFRMEKEVALQRNLVGVGLQTNHRSQAVGQVTQAGVTDDTISGYAWPSVTD